MEQNGEHLLVNILIYHMHQTEQYARRYDVMNMASESEDFGTGEKRGGEVNLVQI